MLFSEGNELQGSSPQHPRPPASPSGARSGVGNSGVLRRSRVDRARVGKFVWGGGGVGVGRPAPSSQGRPGAGGGSHAGGGGRAPDAGYTVPACTRPPRQLRTRRRPGSSRQQHGPASGPRGRAGAGGGGSAVAMATRGVRPSPCSPSAAFAASPPARRGRRLLLRGPGSAGRQQRGSAAVGSPGLPAAVEGAASEGPRQSRRAAAG